MAAALIFVPGWMPRPNRDGNTCVEELYFYTDDGAYTPKTVYAAADLMTPLPFPVLSDASGVFPQIWADDAQVFTVSGRTREADPQTQTLQHLRPAVDVLEGAPGPAGPAGPAGPQGPVGPAGTGTGDMLRSANLSDVMSAATSLSNLNGLSKAGGVMTGSLTLAANASSPLEPATKQQLDAAILNAGKRARVRVATTGNITIATALNGGDMLDGITLTTGDLVLVKDQTAAEQNGVYVVGLSPARSADFDEWGEFPGSLLAVEEGTLNADTLWICTSNDGGTLGTTAITFARIRIDITIPVPVAQGGTGATDAASARASLGAEPQGQAFGINTQAATYTLVLGDAGQIVEMNNGSANNLTVPPNSSVAFPVKTRIDLVQYGAGQTTIVAGGGVTIRSSGARLKLTGQYSGAALYKRGTDEWVLVGDLTA